MTSNPQKVSIAIEQGLFFLLKQQTPVGRFNSMSARSINCINDDFESFDDANQKAWVSPDNFSIFPSLLICACLQHIPKPFQNHYSQIILQKLYEYILTHRRSSGLWNHFESHSKPFKSCPHDIDSTVYAATVLRKANLLTNPPDRIILKQTNKAKLFYTFFIFRAQLNTSLLYWWVCSREALHPIYSYFVRRIQEFNRNDIDAVVNANVLYYLGPSKSTNAPLQWIIECVQNGKESTMDKWYKNRMVIYYFITRLLSRGFDEVLQTKSHILNYIDASIQHNGSIDDKPLDTALAINVLLNFNESAHHIAPLVDYLLNTQQADGEWPARVVYTGGPKRIMGWGGTSLTTAFCLEALSRFAERFPNNV